MAKKKPKSTAANAPATIPAPAPPQPTFFPFARYTSIVGVHTSLLTFTALYLPRTSFKFDALRPSIDLDSLTSKDRPQHPFLEELTLSPVNTLLWLCIGCGILQAWWAGWVRNWWLDSVLVGSDEERRIAKARINSTKLKSLRGAWMTTFIFSLVYYCIIVFLGAPITTYKTHTYLLAVLLSTLTILPATYILGSPFGVVSSSNAVLIRFSWTKLFIELKLMTPVERALVFPAYSALGGAWLGAIPIPLDWDRPWQAWPLTPSYGAIFGYIIGSMIALTVNAIKSLSVEPKPIGNKKLS